MTRPIDKLSKWTRVAVAIAGGVGLVLALGLASFRVTNSSEPLDGEAALGDFVFAVVYMMPFALSLWALTWKDAAQQAAVWLAGGVMAFLESFSAFSGVSLVFLPTAPILILAGLYKSANVVSMEGLRHALPVLPVAAVLSAVGVGAFFVMLTLTSDPRCWVLNRYPDGHTVWEADPTAYIVVENLPGGGQRGSGGGGGIGGPAVNGVQRLQSTCTSDIISPLESAASLGMWALAVAALELVRRHGGRMEARPALGG